MSMKHILQVTKKIQDLAITAAGAMNLVIVVLGLFFIIASFIPVPVAIALGLFLDSLGACNIYYYMHCKRMALQQKAVRYSTIAMDERLAMQRYLARMKQTLIPPLRVYPSVIPVISFVSSETTLPDVTSHLCHVKYLQQYAEFRRNLGFFSYHEINAVAANSASFEASLEAEMYH